MNTATLAGIRTHLPGRSLLLSLALFAAGIGLPAVIVPQSGPQIVCGKIGPAPAAVIRKKIERPAAADPGMARLFNAIKEILDR